jgi:hypothetical protein
LGAIKEKRKLMKRIIITLIGILLLSFSFPNKNKKEIYEYNGEFFNEKIELGEDYKFKHEYRTEFLQIYLKGNYRIKGDSLILDSSPQRDKIIVRESSKGRLNTHKFKVVDKTSNPINYQLHLISKNHDTITLKNQYIESKLTVKDLKSFYIYDTKGLKSPTYNIVGLRTNYFEIQFETNRVLDNEVWRINEDQIFPLGMNGEKQNYFLTKQAEK